MNETLNATATVTIISIWSKIEGIEGAALGRDRNFKYHVEVPCESSVEATLENAFCATNIDERPNGSQCCATTTGDIMVLNEQHYLIERSGYSALSAAQSEAVQKLTSRDTSFGLAWLITHNLIPAV